MTSDFWWTTPEEARRFPFLCVGHHDPISDNDEPLETRWFHSLVNGRFSENKLRYPIDFLEKWRARCSETNVYRSLKLFSAQEEGDVLLGPFLVDIDNSEWDDAGEALREDLVDALDVTRRVTSILTDRWQISESDLRIFFSGRKGFNVEVRPEALGISGDQAERLRMSFEKLRDLTDAVSPWSNTTEVTNRGTVLDPIYGTRGTGPFLRHPFVRLHDSINLWKTRGGFCRRRKVPIALANLGRCDVEAIIRYSEA